MAAKKWWKSKTLRFNLLIALGVAVESNLALLHPFIGDAGYAVFAMLVPTVNVGLRFISTTELSA